MKRDWEKTFNDQEASGLTRAEYCRKHNIQYDHFQYHVKRRGRFLPVLRAEQSLEIILKSGAKLLVTNSSDMSLVKKVLEADAEVRL